MTGISAHDPVAAVVDRFMLCIPAFGSSKGPSSGRAGRRPGGPAAWPDPPAAAPGVPELRILVVEDDALIQMLMVETLVSMGHQVCAVAATESDAVEAALGSRPDLMIVDKHLASGNGLAAVRKIRLTRAVPYILVSGDDVSADQLEPGAVALQKPYQEPDLARAIARAMTLAGGRAPTS